MDTGNVTIKVPWMLLNLTLDSSILGRPAPYFPCAPYDGPISEDTRYTLGRAFAQATFLAVNWRPKSTGGSWFLAQAPGPNVGVPNVKAIDDADDTIQTSPLQWEQTWSGVWHPLPESSPLATPLPVSKAITVGAKAGIGIGSATGALLAIALVAYALARRRRKKRNRAIRAADCASPGHSGKETMGTASFAVDGGPQELSHEATVELYGGDNAMRQTSSLANCGPQELGSGTVLELHGGQQGTHEMLA
ncbi:MAG: hypothetical protein Q9162_006740 [Coniocarpon cinnabarinum]